MSTFFRDYGKSQLTVKVKHLAEESRIIRAEEQKFRRWKERIVIQDVGFGGNYVTDMKAARPKWEVKLLECPRGRPNMPDDEREAYRKEVWKYRARLRKLNPRYSPEKIHNLRLHRIGPVRLEARLSQLAYGYLRGKIYANLEQPKEKNNLNGDNYDVIWRMVCKFGRIDDTPENRKTFNDWFSPVVPLVAEPVAQQAAE